MRETLTTKEAAEILGISEQAVRIQIQRNILPIGISFPDAKNTRNRYLISKAKLYAFLGKEPE